MVCSSRKGKHCFNLYSDFHWSSWLKGFYLEEKVKYFTILRLQCILFPHASLFCRCSVLIIIGCFVLGFLLAFCCFAVAMCVSTTSAVVTPSQQVWFSWDFIEGPSILAGWVNEVDVVLENLYAPGLCVCWRTLQVVFYYIWICSRILISCVSSTSVGWVEVHLWSSGMLVVHFQLKNNLHARTYYRKEEK